MAAPIYTQMQVQGMLSAPKYVPFDAWEERFAGRNAVEDVSHRIRAFPRDEADNTQFWIEHFRSTLRYEFSLTLIGELVGYPRLALCRYEWQSGRHANPKWFPPQFIPKFALHKHVYSERAILENWPWDKCASLCCKPGAPSVSSIQGATDRLTPMFLQELNIEVHDPDFRKGLFGA